jgi:glucose dehydrogenase
MADPTRYGALNMRIPGSVWLPAVLGTCLAVQPVDAQQGPVDDFVPVTDAMLRDPDPGDWLMVHRIYDFQAFSPLDQIDRENVGELRVAWIRAMDEGPQQFRPLVYDGVMYIANPGSDHLQALDATTGDRFDAREFPCGCDPTT